MIDVLIRMREEIQGKERKNLRRKKKIEGSQGRKALKEVEAEIKSTESRVVPRIKEDSLLLRRSKRSIKRRE